MVRGDRHTSAQCSSACSGFNLGGKGHFSPGPFGTQVARADDGPLISSCQLRELLTCACARFDVAGGMDLHSTSGGRHRPGLCCRGGKVQHGTNSTPASLSRGGAIVISPGTSSMLLCLLACLIAWNFGRRRKPFCFRAKHDDTKSMSLYDG
jgi:hypothetical protein